MNDSTGDEYTDEVMADDGKPSASLAALIAEGEAMDRATPEPLPGGAPAPAPVDNAAELHVALTLARDMALPILPGDKGAKLAAVWSDTVLQRVSAAGAAVMDLHGLTMSGVMGKYGAYIVLVASLAGPVIQSRAILAEPPPKQAPEVLS